RDAKIPTKRRITRDSNVVTLVRITCLTGMRTTMQTRQQADRFVAKLQKHNKPVTYLLYPDEPHDFRQPENWISLFAVAERFFHEHLGGRYEPIGNAMTGSSIKIMSQPAT